MSSSIHANRTAALELLGPLLTRAPVAALAALPERFEVHLVGGVLRDRLLGGQPHDVDAVVASDGQGAAESLARALGVGWFRLGGDRFAAYRLDGESFRMDVWERGEMSVTADLRRRDLTINSIALRLSDLTLLDPFGGLEDLDRRRLRATSDTSFFEDPLRVLRLARFAAQLPGFAATERTLELARESSSALEGVAHERVREELRSALGSGGADRAIEVLDCIGLYPALWSDRGEAESRPTPPLERLRRLAARAGELRATRRVDDFVASQAVLLAELPDGEARLRALLERRWLTTRDSRDISRMLEWRAFPATDAERRWMLHRAGDLWPTLAAYLGSAAADEVWLASARHLDRLATQEAETIFEPKSLLDGNQIAVLLEIDPGPRLGNAVEALRRAQVEGRITTPEAAARFLSDRAEE